MANPFQSREETASIRCKYFFRQPLKIVVHTSQRRGTLETPKLGIVDFEHKFAIVPSQGTRKMLKTKKVNRLLPTRSGRMGTQMKIAKVLFPLSLVLLSGCVVGPNYQSPTAAVPAKFSQGGQAEAADVTLKPWWEAFRDRKLNGLVAQGLSENLDVQQSIERIIEARANVIVAASGGLPQIKCQAVRPVSPARMAPPGSGPAKAITAKQKQSAAAAMRPG